MSGPMPVDLTVANFCNGGQRMVKGIAVQGVFTENCYFYIDDVSNSGFLIDPGTQAGIIYDVIMHNGWTIEKILLTHGHFDHFGAAEQLR